MFKNLWVELRWVSHSGGIAGRRKWLGWFISWLELRGWCAIIRESPWVFPLVVVDDEPDSLDPGSWWLELIMLAVFVSRIPPLVFFTIILRGDELGEFSWSRFTQCFMWILEAAFREPLIDAADFAQVCRVWPVRCSEGVDPKRHYTVSSFTVYKWRKGVVKICVCAFIWL